MKSNYGSVTKPYRNHKKTRLGCSSATSLPLRTVSPTSRRCLELVTLPVGNADAERSFSCISAATKEVFKEQSWVRIVYPTQHLWTFTMSFKWTLTKLSRNSTKRIIVAYSQEASCSANYNQARNFRSVRMVRVVYHLPKISGLSRRARLDASYNMKLVRNSRNL